MAKKILGMNRNELLCNSNFGSVVLANQFRRRECRISIVQTAALRTIFKINQNPRDAAEWLQLSLIFQNANNPLAALETANLASALISSQLRQKRW